MRFSSKVYCSVGELNTRRLMYNDNMQNNYLKTGVGGSITIAFGNEVVSIAQDNNIVTCFGGRWRILVETSRKINGFMYLRIELIIFNMLSEIQNDYYMYRLL